MNAPLHGIPAVDAAISLTDVHRARQYEVDNLVDCRVAASDSRDAPTTRGNCMREYLMPIFVVAALALAGCNKSKSPEDVSKDVANAAQKASNEVTESEE